MLKGPIQPLLEPSIKPAFVRKDNRMDSTDKPTPSGRGGARPGAGRPPGSTMMRVAKDARDQAIATGLLPHEILLSMGRGEPQRTPATIDQDTGEVLTWKWETLPPADRRDAAKAAAPYYAPKISTVEVIAGVNDDDLDRIIAGLAAETGVGLGVDREGEESEGEEGEGGDDPAPTPAAGGRERRSAKRID